MRNCPCPLQLSELSEPLANLLGLMAAVQGGPQQPQPESGSPPPHSIMSHSPAETEVCCDEATGALHAPRVSLWLCHQDASNGTGVPHAPGCGTRLRDEAGLGCPPPRGPAAQEWGQPSSLDAFLHGPGAGPPSSWLQKTCTENVTTGVPGEMRALIQAYK